MHYNTVLRSLLRRYRAKQAKAKQGNTKVPEAVEAEDEVEYRTTIHMISSGIVKLAEEMPRPESRMIYRGLSGMQLPSCFYKGDSLGWKGAVEVAFMSCTLKRDVALEYIGKGSLPTLFEIETSQIDRGASLSWLSQYPNEEEVLLPPLSNLEVKSEPKMMVFQGKAIQVFAMQLNVNLKIMKREEHEGSRKALHLASVHNTHLEVRRDLRHRCLAIRVEDKRVKAKLRGEQCGNEEDTDDAPLDFQNNKGFQKANAIADTIMVEVDVLVGMQEGRPNDWYVVDSNYKLALEEVALLKEMAFAKFKWWLESPSVNVNNIDQLSMLQVMKSTQSKNYHEYCIQKEMLDFNKVERTSDGHLTLDELERCLQRIRPNVNRHHAALLWNQLRALDHADSDGGKLSRSEFARLKSVRCSSTCSSYYVRACSSAGPEHRRVLTRSTTRAHGGNVQRTEAAARRRNWWFFVRGACVCHPVAFAPIRIVFWPWVLSIWAPSHTLKRQITL